MSYEYKDEIIMNLKDYNAGRKITGGTNAFESKLSELDHVYSQASKVDEYEAKAKAFDRIKKQYKDCCYTNEVNGFAYIKEGDFRELCEGIFEDYESGEPNV